MGRLEKQRDWVGHKVMLLYTLKTNGGDVYPEGTIMRVSSLWSGRVSLERLDGPDDGMWRGIRRVSVLDVQLVPDDTTNEVGHIPAPPPKPKKPGRRELLKVITRIQDLAGKAKGAYQDDRAVERWSKVIEPLEEIFNLCVNARRMDPP